MPQDSLEAYRLMNGQIVHGRRIEDEQVLYVTGPNYRDANVLIGQIDDTTTAVSLQKKIAEELKRGLIHFPISNEPTLGIRYQQSKGDEIETYTLFQRQDELVKCSELMFTNSQLSTTRKPNPNIPLNSNLRQNNYFFESEEFITGDDAIEAFNEIQKKGETDLSKYYFL